MYGKFTVKPDWAMLIMRQLGNPQMCMPWRSGSKQSSAELGLVWLGSDFAAVFRSGIAIV
jgi:hypothetical protein